MSGSDETTLWIDESQNTPEAAVLMMLSVFSALCKKALAEILQLRKWNLASGRYAPSLQSVLTPTSHFSTTPLATHAVKRGLYQSSPNLARRLHVNEKQYQEESSLKPLHQDMQQCLLGEVCQWGHNFITFLLNYPHYPLVLYIYLNIHTLICKDSCVHIHAHDKILNKLITIEFWVKW